MCFYLKKLIVIIALFVFIGTYFKNNENVYIPFDSIRLRVISNSNLDEDINKKYEVKDYVEGLLYDLIKDSKSASETDDIIVNNLDYLNLKINNFLNNSDYKIDYGKNYFPSKTYKRVVYDAGFYNSLVITLGEGKGNNWWCVLFPPLCMLDDNNTTSDVEYSLYVSKIIDKYR